MGVCAMRLRAFERETSVTFHNAVRKRLPHPSPAWQSVIDSLARGNHPAKLLLLHPESAPRHRDGSTQRWPYRAVSRLSRRSAGLQRRRWYRRQPRSTKVRAWLDDGQSQAHPLPGNPKPVHVHRPAGPARSALAGLRATPLRRWHLQFSPQRQLSSEVRPRSRPERRLCVGRTFTNTIASLHNPDGKRLFHPAISIF